MVFHATSGNFFNSVVKCLILLQSDLRGVLEICKNQFTVRNMKWVIYFSKVHIAENVSESSSHLLAGSLCTVRCSAYMYNVHAARHLVAHIWDLLPLLYSPNTLTYIHFFGRGYFVQNNLSVRHTK